MAKLLNKHGFISRYVFNPKYDLKFVEQRFLKRTWNWYIIPKDAMLEGL